MSAELLLSYDEEERWLVATDRDGASAIVGFDVPPFIGPEIVRRFDSRSPSEVYDNADRQPASPENIR